MEPEGSLPYSQVPAACPYPESTPSSPHNPLQLPEDRPSLRGVKTRKTIIRTTNAKVEEKGVVQVDSRKECGLEVNTKSC
jgi:hypothetical protein